MQLRVGGCYKTRDGERAFVTHYLEGEQKYPYMGYTVSNYKAIPNSERAQTWAPNGTFNLQQESGCDIISEAPEGKLMDSKGFCIMPDGTFADHTDQPMVTIESWSDGRLWLHLSRKNNTREVISLWI
jgi:hypothetical protein